jgi:hypothetical protein
LRGRLERVRERGGNKNSFFRGQEFDADVRDFCTLPQDGGKGDLFRLAL